MLAEISTSVPKPCTVCGGEIHTASECSMKKRVAHYQEQAMLANFPVVLDLLREARAALPADFYDLACRIDDVIHHEAAYADVGGAS